MRTLKYFLKRLRRRIRQTNLLNYAAQLSYGLMLAFLPLLMLLSLVFNLVFENKKILQETLTFISAYLPDQIEILIKTSLERNESNLVLHLNSSTALNIALLIFMVYSVIRLFHSAMIIFTKISNMKEHRNFIQLWLWAFLDLISVLVLIAISTYVYVEVRVLLLKFVDTFLDPNSRPIFNLFYKRFIYVYITLILGFTINWILSTFPAKKIKYREAVPGTIFVLIGLGIVMLIMKIFSDLLDIEGFILILDQGIIIMITIYLSSLVLLIGLLINNEIRKLRKKKNFSFKKLLTNDAKKN